MLFDANRLAELSGIATDTELGLLRESNDVNELQNLRAQEDADAGSDRDDLEPEERPELGEQRIRNMIRSEIAAVLQEMQEERDLQSITDARRSKNVGVALGFDGFGFGKRRGKNRAAAKGAGSSMGFGGPGFM